MIHIDEILEPTTNPLAITYTFDLKRSVGKKQSLKKGNQMLNMNDRMHFTVKGPITQYLRELALATIWATDPPFSPSNPLYTPDKPCIVNIKVSSPTRREMDTPNVYPTVKALIDGMTDAGLWSDDNDTVIKLMSFCYGGITKTKKYKLEITIIPVEVNDDKTDISI